MNRCFALACAIAVVLASPLASFGQRLWPSTSNTDWLYDADKDRAVYIGDPGNEAPSLSVSLVRLNDLPRDFLISTDSVTATVSGADQTFEIPFGNEPVHRVQFDANGEAPRILVSRRAPPALQALWIRLVRARPIDFKIRFPSATYVIVQFSAPAGEIEVPSIPEDAKPDEPDGASNLTLKETGDSSPSEPQRTPPDPGVLADRLRRSVVQVSIELPGQTKPSVFGSAFLVDDDGFAITNLHVVTGAARGWASFEGNAQRYDIELWAASEPTDLALIRILDPAQADPKRPVWSPLPLADNAPQVGEDVWAAGYPLGLGFTLTKGIVNGIRDIESNGVTQIQTDATINSGNSGGPLVNRSGVVVGVNTFKLTRGDNLYFAISASHVRSLLSKRSGAPAGFKSVQGHGDLVRVGTSLPTLEMPLRSRPLSVARAAAAMKRHLPCPRCNGDGRVQVRVQTGWRGSGTFRIPVYKTVSRTCSTCSGARIDSVADSFNLIDRLVTLLAHADSTVDNGPARLDATRQLMLDAATINVERFSSALLHRFRMDIIAQEAKEGTPVMLIGRVIKLVRSDDTGDRYYIIQAGDNLIILWNVKLQNCAEGDRALVCGLLAGYYESPQSQGIYPVLVGGAALQVGG